MIRVPFLVLTALALLPSAPAAGRDAREWRQMRVDASALDLSERTGIEELSRRIDRAVNRICGSDRACRDEAWASTEEQVAWAIRRDEWTRRLAAERAAELRACGRRGCARPTYYAPPPPVPAGGVTVTIIHTSAPFSAPGWR